MSQKKSGSQIAMIERQARRWRFLVDGYATLTPSFDEAAGIEYMIVETPIAATRCYSQEEVERAMDIAMYYAQEDNFFYIH